MAAPSTLQRWLPTMLGALVALGVVMAYELDFVGDEAAEVDCEAPQADDAEGAGPSGRGLSPASRRHPSGQAAEQRVVSAEDEVAKLEAETELLAERVVTGELDYYGQTQAELEAMARHCDVRVDYPTALSEQHVEDLGLGPDEKAAYERALKAYQEQEHRRYRELYAELHPEIEDVESLSPMEVRKGLAREIRRKQAPGDDEVQRHVAEERAGLRDAPDPAELSTFNRYNRLRFSAGDRFAELLGEEIGDERAHELRSALGGWPGARTRQWGCKDEQ